MVEKVFTQFLRVCIIVILLYLFLLSIFCNAPLQNGSTPLEDGVMAFDRVSTVLVDNPIVHIGFLVALLILLYCFREKMNEFTEKLEKNRIAAYVFFMVVGTTFILTTRVYPSSDAVECLEVAIDVLKGDVSAYTEKTGYMFRYPFQNGVVLLDIGLIKLFGNNSHLVFQFLNLLAELILIIYIGRIVSFIWKDSRESGMTRLFVFAFPAYFLFVLHTYGDWITLSLAVMAVYYMFKFTECHQIGFMILSCFLSGISSAIKGNNRIIAIAMGITLILNMFDKKKIINIAFIVLLVVARITSTKAIDGTMERITGVDTPKGAPMINTVCMGIVRDGTFNGINGIIFRDSGYDYDKSVEISKDFIKTRFKTLANRKLEGARWLGSKTAVNYADPTYNAFGMNARSEYALFNSFYKSLFSGELGEFITKYLNCFQSIIYLLALLSLLNTKKINRNTMFFALCFLGGFAFHFVWEASAHYILRYLIILFPYAADGICNLVDSFKNRKYGIFSQMAVVAVIGIVVYTFRDIKIIQLLFFVS